MIFFVFCSSLSYGQEKSWWKGNLHTHSLWSDGDDYPEMIMDWYKSNGYHFVALSDHNILAEGEKWIDVSKQFSRKAIFEEYLARFGEEWVEYRDDNNQLKARLKTLQEYRVLFEKPGEFLIIKSEEITDGFEDKPIHVNATNVRDLIQPQGGNSVVEVMQNNIDAVLQQREESGVPMFPHINHPNFGWAISADDLIALTGDKFFEVYNGHPLVNNDGDSAHHSTEQIWDMVLTNYILNGKGPIYGLATDDSHHYHVFGSDKSNPGRGWVMVRSEQLEVNAIIAAMESGDFYSSTGIALKIVKHDGQDLKIEVDPEEGVNYSIQFIGTRKDQNKTGILLKEIKGTMATYQFEGDELYVRAKIISDKLKKNPYRPGEFEVAWTQPVIVDSE